MANNAQVKYDESMSMMQLVGLYNELTGKSIKKFDSKAKGVQRIQAFLEKNAPETAVAADKDEDKTPVQKKGKRKIAEADAARTQQIAILLRKTEKSIDELRSDFNTSYKNITGSLFDIRHGQRIELMDDEQLVRRRDGLRSFYSIRPIADTE